MGMGEKNVSAKIFVYSDSKGRVKQIRTSHKQQRKMFELLFLRMFVEKVLLVQS